MKIFNNFALNSLEKIAKVRGLKNMNLHEKFVQLALNTFERKIDRIKNDGRNDPPIIYR